MDRAQVAARYEIRRDDLGGWTDIREARPRCRVKATTDDVVVVLVDRDGNIDVTGGSRDLDFYQDEKYGDIEGREVQL